MAGDRSRYGLVVSALGASVLAVSVFLPWYGLSLTAAGADVARQATSQLASLTGAHLNLAALTGQQLTALDAQDALKGLSVVLLALSGLAILDALFPLVRGGSSVPNGAGGSVVLLGSLACACVVFRMVDPPAPAGGLLALSVREGAWLALLGSLTMVIGGLWPRHELASVSGGGLSRDPFSLLMGWTTEA